MNIKEVMVKKFPLIYVNEPLDKVLKILISIPESSLPVINKKKQVIGEIDQHNLLLLDIAPEELGEESLDLNKVKLLFKKKKRTVKDFMTKHNFTLSLEDNILDAAKLMYDEDLSTLPVVDKNKRLLGILTDISILKHYKKILNKR
ncbi:CBS domain-containing protein [Candidatus Woesearchaeota archaeon]|nr:CBS domain-containing protein [Candidatus Woesearchaeota archaeon]